MLIRIERLGPLKNSIIELGDITLLLGPPNTGKSYTLKALYAKLFLLDKYSLDAFGRTLSNSLERELNKEVSIVLPEDSLKILRELLNTWVETFVAATLLSLCNDVNDVYNKVEEILKKSIGEKGFNVRIEKLRDTLLVRIRSPPIGLKLHPNILDRAIKDATHTFMRSSIPVESLYSVTLEPIDIYGLDANYIMRILKYGSETGTVTDVLKQMWLLSAPILEEVIHILHTVYEHVYEHVLIRFLRYRLRDLEIAFPPYFIIREVFIKRPRIRLETSISPRQDGLELISKLIMTFRFNISVMKEFAKRTIDEETMRKIVADAPKEVIEDPVLRATLDQAANSMREWLLKACSNILSKNIYNILRGVVMSRTRYENLRFVPFGRSVVLLGLESAAREPYLRAEHLRKLIDELYPNILASYAYWTSRGRGLLLDGKLTEEQRRLVEAAIPLLEGVLTTDGSGRLLYRDWRGSNVELQLASALVNEVSGILLPLLTVKGRSLILIEEPEAQLHPGAQIIMALFLSALPKLCNCKVIASTHSDLLAITLSQLVVQKPSKEWIEKLVKSLLPHVKEGIEALVSAVAESIKDLDVRIYEYTREGVVKPVKPEDVLSKEVPGISKVIDTLTEWAFHLAAHRSAEGKF